MHASTDESVHDLARLYRRRAWPQHWPTSANRLVPVVAASLAVAWAVDWYLVPWGYPVAAIYGLPVVLAAWRLPAHLVGLTAAFALAISVTSSIVQHAPLVAWSVDNFGLALIGAVTGLFVEQRHAAARNARQAAVAEAHYRSIFDASADAIVVTDTNGRCIDANPATAQLFGYTLEEMRNADLGTLLFPEPDRDRLTQEFIHISNGSEWRGELPLLRKNGSTMQVEGRVVKFDAPGGGSEYRGAWRDVSERHALERLQREFLAMVTHELRNPLTPIRGYANLLQRRRTYDERIVRSIVTATDHLDRLIGDLLAVAQLETGHLELRRERMDLVAVARMCAERAQAASPDRRVRVETAGEQVYGVWDRDRVEQVLDNLLSNAAKYSPAGSEIVVAVEDVGLEARVSVKDQGAGIAADVLPHLFERFTRASTARSQARGLGLGLFITRGLVEGHGGRIWVESEPGVGSTFRFTLPYHASHEPAAAFINGLTPRQVEIAILVAEGKSNREIAEVLVLTPGTVTNHVKRILARLDLHSRAQIAAWATDRGLHRPERR
ncbi:MAG: PAS domain S-box protein [Chloroflexi bacterium]|nr:PAS domain S-box protein [Chloroflexota bacterium]